MKEFQHSTPRNKVVVFFPQIIDFYKGRVIPVSVQCQLLTTWNTRNKSHRFTKHHGQRAHRKCLDRGGLFKKVIGRTLCLLHSKPDFLRPPEPHSNNWRLTIGVRGNIRCASPLCGKSRCVMVFIKLKHCPPKKILSSCSLIF